MSATIISMATRQAITPAEPEMIGEVDISEFFDVPENAESPVTKDLLAKLDRFRALVEKGRVTTVVLAAQDNATGYFVTEFVHDKEMDRCELFGLIGVLDTLKTEIKDLACMAPVINLDGEIIDPYLEEEAS